MYWLDNDSGVTTPPAIPPVVSATRKWFTEGGAGEQPSIPGGEWFNMMTDELLAVLTAAGITPTKANHAQLLAALQAMYPNKSGDTMEGDLYGITAPQFANDERFATTEFIKRALGNHRDSYVLSAGTALSDEHVGAVITSAGVGPYTFALPSLASIPLGSTITIFNTSSVLYIDAAGADKIIVNEGSGVSSLSFGPGEFITFVARSPGYWSAFGSGQQKYAASFGASLAASGYQKLPSGLLLQWGSTPVAGNSTTTVTLPIAFPNAFHQCVVSIKDNVSTYASQPVATALPLSNSQVSIRSYYTSSNNVSWIAIGY